MNKLVLIDGNAMMHRAYHALPPLTTSEGSPVHVVYGFLSMIMRLFSDLKPTHMAIAFDRPGPTFRNELFEQYQAQRPKMEDDFISQIPLVHDAVTSFGIPLYELDGFEADDVIGTIVHQATEPGANGTTRIDQVIIVTGDRDILQLVSGERTLVFMPTKGLSEGKLYGEAEVTERMGVAPKMIIDLKALMGDASDNYSGVAGIGPKTAITLLTRYGSIERIYSELESGDIGNTIKAKLISGKESAALGKALATIRQDAPIVFDAEAARVTSFATPSARAVLEKYRFTSLIKRLGLAAYERIEKTVSVPAQKKEPDQQQLF